MPRRPGPKIVLDSVILVSAFLTRDGLAADLLLLCAQNATLCTAEAILRETRRVLLEKGHIRRKYAYDDRQVERFIEYVRSTSSVVSNLPDIRAVRRDPKDDVILACAVAAPAEYLITRDPHLLALNAYEGVKILSPEDYIRILRAQS